MLGVRVGIENCSCKERFPPMLVIHAGVAKLVDVPALGAGGATHGGSSPLPGTNTNKKMPSGVFLF